jgi:hypothetical protein
MNSERTHTTHTGSRTAEALDRPTLPVDDAQVTLLNWQRILSVARDLAWRTGQDVDEMAAIMREGIIEAALKEEDFLSRPDAQIVTRGKWAAQNRLRRQRRCVSVEDETLEWLVVTDGGISEAAIAVRQAVADLEGDLERIVTAVIEGHGLKQNGRVNVSALSRELGIPTNTVRRRVMKLQETLAPLIAFT